MKKNRFAALLLALGLLTQLHSAYLETHEPVLPATPPFSEPTSAPDSGQIASRLLVPRGFTNDPSAFGYLLNGPLEVVPIAQQTAISDGQASVAMAINCLTGKSLNDKDIDKVYGYELLRALREECAEVGLNWKDGGEIGPNAWELVEHKVEIEKLPVILAVNGPEFSVNGRGHIVLISGVQGDKVTFADPATGTTRTSTRQHINDAPQHPQGNFIFYADRELDAR